MRYRIRMGCRFGQPHDLKIISDSRKAKHEVCMRCNKKFRWNKGFKERIENREYLKIHVRNFCQRSGPTLRIYNKIYNKNKTIIKI